MFARLGASFGAVCAAFAVLTACNGSGPPPLPSGARATRDGAPAVAADGKYRIIYSFDGAYGVGGPNGGPPLAAPVLDAAGNLYGPAGGGTGNYIDCNGPCGVIFKMSQSGGKWKESVALNISSWFHQAWPDSALAFDQKGNMYGGIGEWIYKLAPSGSGSWSFTPIYKNTHDAPGGVVPDSAGNLYGWLGKGVDYCGTIGELSPRSSGWGYADLHNICRKDGFSPGGSDPRSPFSFDSRGNLYGTQYTGGPYRATNGYGTAFEMIRGGNGKWTYRVLHKFGAFRADGQNPWGGLAIGKSDSAYGTTIDGGPHGHGEIFELTPTRAGRWKERVLYGFPDVTLGAYPWGSLAFDASGNLYGVGNGGKVCGPYFCGEIFKLTPQRSGGWAYSLLHSFSGPDGEYPYGGLAIDKNGHLFGTALGGGTYNYGVVFEIST
jgi:hypothetical protein